MLCIISSILSRLCRYTETPFKFLCLSILIRPSPRQRIESAIVSGPNYESPTSGLTRAASVSVSTLLKSSGEETVYPERGQCKMTQQPTHSVLSGNFVPHRIELAALPDDVLVPVPLKHSLRLQFSKGAVAKPETDPRNSFTGRWCFFGCYG